MSNRRIETLQLFAYSGPNIWGAQPGVMLRVRCTTDQRAAIRNSLKDGAQFVGMILAYLEVQISAAEPAPLITAHFITPTPELGRDLAAYVIDGVAAQLRGDEDWDRDGPLFALQKRRRRESLPVAALELVAEARARGLPVLMRPDRRVQFGYGSRSWHFDPHAATDQLQPPWSQLGAVPLYVITGEQRRSAAVAQIGHRLAAAGYAPRVLDNAGYTETAALLADPQVELAVIGLRSAEVLQRGVAFERCTQAIISDRAGPRPPAAYNDDEWLRALGVPMLLSANPAVFDPTVAELADLVRYAPHGVLPPGE